MNNEKQEPLTFELNENEMVSYEKWKKKLPKKYINKEHTFSFTPTGIGTAIEVEVTDVPETRENITDFDNW